MTQGFTVSKWLDWGLHIGVVITRTVFFLLNHSSLLRRHRFGHHRGSFCAQCGLQDFHIASSGEPLIKYKLCSLVLFTWRLVPVLQCFQPQSKKQVAQSG